MLTASSSLIASSAGAAIIAVAASVLFLTLSRAGLRLRRAIRHRSVFAPTILQPAGFRIRRRLDRQRDRLRAACGALAVLPLMFLAVLLAWPGELDADPTRLRWAAMLSAAIVIVIYLFGTLVRCALRLRRTRADLAARLALSHALERVMRRDFAVFHDVDFADVVTDEIVVGRQGVFALTVFTLPGGSGAGAPAEFRDGHVALPDGRRIDVATACRRHANALSRHLSQALREQVPVTAVAVLPGWRITCSGQPPFPVVSERNVDMITEWTGPDRYLLDEQVDAIQSYLTERSRDPRYRD